MIEKLHQFDQSQFRVFTVHIIDLSAKSLSKGMAAKVTNMQPVFPFQFFQDNVYPLD